MATTTRHRQFPANSSSQLMEEHAQCSTKFYPEELDIAWGEDSRYWNIPKDGSPAELKRVCWLEVACPLENTEPEKEYEVGFNISLTPDAFGWSNSPVYILVKRGRNGKFFTRGNFDLDSVERGVNKIMRVKVGKSEQTGKTLEDSELRFVMCEVWAGKWKGGLKINYAFIEEVA